MNVISAAMGFNEGVVGSVTPKKPTRSPPTRATVHGTTPSAAPNGSPASSRTFADTHVWGESATTSRVAAGPKSKSWLPNVSTSVSTAR